MAAGELPEWVVVGAHVRAWDGHSPAPGRQTSIARMTATQIVGSPTVCLLPARHVEDGRWHAGLGAAWSLARSESGDT